ncbi:MAG: DUF1707 SHOCT-like domain-containing protein [Candidatus Nanopelagicales bacterium]
MNQQLRLTDAERGQASDRLGEHYALGRLDKDEYDERRDAVWSAKTHGDLQPLFSDLEVEPLRPPGQDRGYQHRHRAGPPPLFPLLFVLIALSAVSRFPFVLLALAMWPPLAGGIAHRHLGRRALTAAPRQAGGALSARPARAGRRP